MALYDESGGIENTGIRRQVIKEITDFAKKYDVKKILLFGSRQEVILSVRVTLI